MFVPSKHSPHPLACKGHASLKPVNERTKDDLGPSQEKKTLGGRLDTGYRRVPKSSRSRLSLAENIMLLHGPS